MARLSFSLLILGCLMMSALAVDIDEIKEVEEEIFEQAVQMDKNQTKEFILGLALGTESTVGNITECIGIVFPFIIDFNQFKEDYAAYVADPSTALLLVVLGDLKGVLEEFSKVYVDCGLHNIIISFDTLLLDPNRFFIQEVAIWGANQPFIKESLRMFFGHFLLDQYSEAGTALGGVIGLLLGPRPRIDAVKQ